MTQPPQQPQFQMQPSIPGNGLGIASLVLGIIALCLFCVPVLPWLLAIIAIILGAVSMAQAGGAPTGKAKIGMILGVVAIVAGMGFWFAFKRGAQSLSNVIQQKSEELQKKAEEESQRLQDEAKKQQEQMQKMQNTPATQPGAMLTHPHGWSVYIA